MCLILLTFVVSLLASVLSGMSGGGGAFILTPYYILIGLTPQQAVATGKVAGLGVAGGAITAFKGKGLVRKQLLWPLIGITIGSSFLASWLFPKLQSGTFQIVIGVLLLLLIPTLFINKQKLQPGPRTAGWLWAGYVVYVAESFVQAMFGSGLAVLLTLNLIMLFGLTALEANATKRVAQAVQSVLMFVLLLFQGFVVLGHGAATFLGSFVGSHIGSKLAIKRGERFVKYALALMMAISGVALIATR